MNIAERPSALKPIDDRKLFRISRGELERRWRFTRDLLRERGIGALITQSTRDFMGGYVKWFTDTAASNARTVVFHADGGMSVVEHGPMGGRRTLDGNDPRYPGVTELVTTAAFSSAHYTQGIDAEAVIALLRKRGYKRIGLVGAASTPHEFVARITAAMQGQAEIVDLTDVVDEFKAVKSGEEIAMIRATAHMQDDVFSSVLAEAKPGMRDFEITALARYAGELVGSEQGLFMASSAKLGLPAPLAPRNAQGRTMREGDTMTLLIENNGFGGFYTELARSIVFGKASQELLDACEACKEAQAHTLEQFRPGASCRDIALAHDAFMTARGLPPEKRLYSHAQGYDLVERPLIRADETMVLAAGMNMALHPGYATSSLFVTVCDNYMVEQHGPSECLHRTAKRVFEI